MAMAMEEKMFYSLKVYSMSAYIVATQGVKCSIFLREKLKCVVFGIVVTLCGKVLGQVECCELFLDIT